MNQGKQENLAPLTTTTWSALRPVDLCWEGKVRWIQVGVKQSAQIWDLRSLHHPRFYLHVNTSMVNVHDTKRSLICPHWRLWSLLRRKGWLKSIFSQPFLHGTTSMAHVHEFTKRSHLFWLVNCECDSNHVQAHWSLALAEALTSETKGAPSIFKLWVPKKCWKRRNTTDRVHDLQVSNVQVWEIQDLARSWKSKTWTD